MMLLGALQYKGKLKERVDRTALVYLSSSRKLMFMRYRWFLERKHKYHKMKRHLNNIVKKDSAPKWYTEKLLFEMVKSIKVVFGKGTVKGQKRKKTPTSIHIPFKKQSIFSSIFHTERILKLGTTLI
jgi:hypothetical protein